MDRNGFGYTIDRETGVPLVAEKFDPAVNWADRIDLTTGEPVRVEKYSTAQGVNNNVEGICDGQRARLWNLVEKRSP